MVRLISVALLLIAALNASAQVRSLAGFGASSCREYLDLRARNEQMADTLAVFWLQGFLSGFNGARAAYARIDPTHIPESEELLRRMDSICRADPSEPIFKGAMQLLRR